MSGGRELSSECDFISFHSKALKDWVHDVISCEPTPTQLQRRRKVLEVGGAPMMVRALSTRMLGVFVGVLPPKNFKPRCSELEIASEAIFVLKSGQFLP